MPDKHIQKVHHRSYLQHKQNGHPVAELLLLCLMAEKLHRQPCAHAAAQCRKPQQRGLRHTPASPTRLPLVQAEDHKRQHVHRQKIIYQHLLVNYYGSSDKCRILDLAPSQAQCTKAVPPTNRDRDPNDSRQQTRNQRAG